MPGPEMGRLLERLHEAAPDAGAAAGAGEAALAFVSEEALAGAGAESAAGVLLFLDA